jgi:hypothetical protein
VLALIRSDRSDAYQYAGELIIPHEDEADESASAVGSGLEKLKGRGGRSDLSVQVDLFLCKKSASSFISL